MKINILPDNSKKNRAPEPAPVFKPYYTGSSKALAFLGNNLLYLISFLFPVVVLFTLMALNGFAPFGDKNLFILDGSVYNLPHFATFVEQLHSGNFSFFMEGGVLGKEYFSTIAFYLCSPLHLLLCFFSQETAIVLLAVVTVLQIGFAGFSMTFYLTHRLKGYKYSKYDYSVLLFSFAFSLSGYFLVQYNDFMYLDCVILFPLLFLALEHLLYKDTYKYFYGLLAFCFFCNFYMAAIIFVLLFFYVLTRKKGDFTNSVAKCIKYLFTGIFAALTSAVTVIPGFYFFYLSQIKTSTIPDASFVQDWLTFYGSFMSKNYGSYVSCANYGSNLYCGLLPVILLFAYFISKKTSVSDKVRNFIFLVFLCIIINFSSFLYWFHFNAVTDSSFNNYCFLLPFFILTISADMLYELRHNSASKTAFCLFTPIILLIIASLKSKHYSSSTSISFSLIMLITYAIVLLFYKSGSIQRKTLRIVLLILLAVEAVINCSQTIQYIAVDASPIADSIVTNSSFHSYCENPFSFDVEEEVSLPLIYNVGNSPQNRSEQYATEFEEQNAITNSLGISPDLFSTADFKFTVHETSDITSHISTNNILSIKVTPDSLKAKNKFNILTLDITPDKDGYLFIHTTDTFYIGYVKKGKTVSHQMTFQTVTNKYANYWIYGAYIDKSVLDSIQSISETATISDTVCNATSFFSNVTCQKKGTLVLNAPYSSFLSVKIDGQSSAYHRSFTDTVALDFPAGTHTISVSYHCVPLYIGCLISLLCICILYLRKVHLLNHMQNLTDRILCSPKIKKAPSWLKCNHILLLSFAIPCTTLFMCLIFLGYTPFGSCPFYSGDGICLVIPTLIQAQDQVSNNSFLYSWTSGGGYNFFYSFPSAILFYWLRLFHPSTILPLFTILGVLGISISGPCLYYYLTHRLNGKRFHKEDSRILLFTTAYSLSAFIINFRNNILWIPIYALFPIILICCDKLIYQKKTLLYMLLLAFCIAINPFFAFFVCIFLALYFFTYKFKGIKDFFIKGLRFAYASLLGAGLSFCSILATYLAFQSTAYSSYDAVKPTFTFYQSYWDSFKQLFIFPESVTVTEQNGAINLYCGLFIIILLFLIPFIKHSKRNILNTIYLAFILFSSNNEILSYIWNGFHYQSKVPNRYSFLAIFLMLDLCSEVVMSIDKKKKKGLWSALLLPVIFVIGILYFSSLNIKSVSAIATLIFIGCYVLILLYRILTKKKRILTKGLLFLATAEIILNSAYSIYKEERSSGKIIDYFTSSTAYCKSIMEDTTLQNRINLIGSFSLNGNMNTQVNSINQFNSFLTQYQFSIGRALGYSTSSNTLTNSRNLSPFSNLLTNTEYIIVADYTDDCVDLDHYTPVASIDNMIILHNPNTLSLGLYYPEQIIDDVRTNTLSTCEAYFNKLVSTFSDHTLFSNGIMLSNQQETDYASSTTYYNSDQELQIRLTFVPQESGIYYYRSSEFYYLGELEAGKQYQYDFPTFDDAGIGFIFKYNAAAFDEYYHNAAPYALQITEFTDTSVKGNITLPDNGYIYLSIPYERGWSATIDGKEATIETAPEGFSMIKASAGTHEVHLTFRPYGLTVCIVGTLIAWIIFLFTILFERRHNKRMLLKAAEADTTLPPAHLRSHQQAEEPHCELPQACSSAPQAPQEGSLPDTACYTDTLSDRSGGQAPDSIADTSAASEMKTQD